MHRDPLPTDDSWESDAVWKLLDESPPQVASPRFADDVVRMARLTADEVPWWKKLFSPAPLAGLAAASAALAFAVVPLVGLFHESASQTVFLDSPQAVAIQDIAETETLIAAADQLEDFSDNELVSLIGF
ncbi:hypothetical protein JIN84_13060 [Luteolibacter yonseiensis]|uniref:Uncharacterized protein n=1 Tax=Luteolibacter yonseiensis TaxID=1144680 RepID=A0A934VAU2_9BACT|nr:hypothetical protein [Luteolibacter yonseiensis]MBK1816548.1 hypothetical protein [Luteolibacter yonseiensis]